MSVIQLGVSHHDAPLDVLERCAVAGDEQPKVLHQLLALDHVTEAVVLSTCNRVEVYARVSRFHQGLDELRTWFADRAGLGLDAFDRIHRVRHDQQVATHLFAVASGLRSMVVGERQITIQVRAAASMARDEGTSRRMLQKLFRQAAEVSRRVRAETDIDDGVRSMVDLALGEAHQRVVASRVRLGMDPPARPTVLLLGAGKLGGLAADRVARAGAEVLVWNRSADKAHRLAARIRATATAAEAGAPGPTADRPASDDEGDGPTVVDDRGLVDAVAAADLVVCTTGAAEPLVTVERVAAAMNRRDGDGSVLGAEDRRPLVLVDLSMPRNVERGCEQLDGVDVVDIADVRDATSRTVAGASLAAADTIVAEEALRFVAWTRSMSVDPALGALRRRAEDVRQAELERLAKRLSGLDGRERAAVDAVTRGIVNTLLHEPSTRLKGLAEQGAAEAHVGALTELFDLTVDDDET